MPGLYVVWAFIVSAIPWVLSAVFKAIGLGFVTYIGLTVGLDAAEQFIFTRFENIGTELFQILTLAGIPEGIKILFSAFAAALVLKTGSRNGTVRRPVWQKPGPFEA
jgi:hypothetical protein